MRTREYDVDLCVVGGGFAGVCAAISAARHGITVVLMQDRPVLGGNASSEIRMWIGGASGRDNRECGILEEIEYENYYLNPQLSFTVWDSVVYAKVKAEKNITLLLNTTCMDATMASDNRIASVKGWQLNTETYHIVRAKYFADCSGDSILVPLTGAACMYGREGKSEYGESIAPDVADKKTMGMSCLFQIRETDHKTTFIKPEWAYTYPKDDPIMQLRKHFSVEGLGRHNWWWIEVGGMQDALHDADECRDELLKIVYGVWDHIKNQDDHGADNWDIDWIGFLPGKRESRRYVGKYIINENDILAEGKHFEDAVAYAGWSMDDHFPEGFYYMGGCSTIWHPAPSPWLVPWRALVARDINNLLFAGRNISVTHIALSSTRVMATTAMLGQALGTGVAQMVNTDTTPDTIDIPTLRQTLMADDCYIPFYEREVSPLSLSAKCTAPVLRDGIDRGDEHMWVGKAGEIISYTFDKPTKVSGVRIIFDSDLNRGCWNMPSSYPLVQKKYKVSPFMMREFSLVFEHGDGTLTTKVYKENRKRFVDIEFDETCICVSLIPMKTYGSDECHIFSFEVR